MKVALAATAFNSIPDNHYCRAYCKLEVNEKQRLTGVCFFYFTPAIYASFSSMRLPWL